MNADKKNLFSHLIEMRMYAGKKNLISHFIDKFSNFRMQYKILINVSKENLISHVVKMRRL